MGGGSEEGRVRGSAGRGARTDDARREVGASSPDAPSMRRFSAATVSLGLHRGRRVRPVTSERFPRLKPRECGCSCESSSSGRSRTLTTMSSAVMASRDVTARAVGWRRASAVSCRRKVRDGSEFRHHEARRRSSREKGGLGRDESRGTSATARLARRWFVFRQPAVVVSIQPPVRLVVASGVRAFPRRVRRRLSTRASVLTSLRRGATTRPTSMGDVVAADGARGGGEGAGSAIPRATARGWCRSTCERCRSRLEVRVPLALQLADRGATVRCGACDALLQVSVPRPSGTLADFPNQDADADTHAVAAAAAAAAVCQRQPFFPSGPEDHQRHLQLARYHMDMAQQHSHAGRSNPAPVSRIGSHSNGVLPHPELLAPPTQDHINRLLRKAARDFWFDTSTAKPAKRPRKPREPSPYNVFIREEIPRLKARDPELSHKEAFKAAARNWADSPLNTRSAAYDPASAGGFGGGGSRGGGGEADGDRAKREEIIRKLHPHILQSREEDTGGEATTMTTTTTTTAAAAAERRSERRSAGGRGERTRVENSGLGADARECESSLEENSTMSKAIDEDADERGGGVARNRRADLHRRGQQKPAGDKSTEVTASWRRRNRTFTLALSHTPSTNDPE